MKEALSAQNASVLVSTVLPGSLLCAWASPKLLWNICANHVYVALSRSFVVGGVLRTGPLFQAQGSHHSQKPWLTIGGEVRPLPSSQ